MLYILTAAYLVYVSVVKVEGHHYRNHRMDLEFTQEPESIRTDTVKAELLKELYLGQDPLSFSPGVQPDFTYNHTFVRSTEIDYFIFLLQRAFGQVHFVMELGSFKGGSAIVISERLRAHAKEEFSLVCIDPFTGDVNMWAWSNQPQLNEQHNYLSLSRGLPTIYSTFRANIVASGHADFIIPIPVTAVVGLRLIMRLVEEERLSYRPQLIYLDSSHEEVETLHEIKLAWALLSEHGILVGDDFNWPAVKHDVCKFSKEATLVQQEQVANITGKPAEECDGVLVWRGQIWMMQKS